MFLHLPWLETRDEHQARMRSSVVALGIIGALAIWLRRRLVGRAGAFSLS